jgi:peptide subunit release factor RF-3
MDRGTLRIGDTLGGDGTLEFQGIPLCAEHFARADSRRSTQAQAVRQRACDSSPRKARHRCSTAETSTGSQPIVGAVGQLQFDVMRSASSTSTRRRASSRRLTYRWPRWVTGPKADVERCVQRHGTHATVRSQGERGSAVPRPVGPQACIAARDVRDVPRDAALNCRNNHNVTCETRSAIGA